MKLRHICTEVNMIYEDLTKIQSFMDKLDDFTVVGSCQKVKIYEDQFLVLYKKLFDPYPVSHFKGSSEYSL